MLPKQSSNLLLGLLSTFFIHELLYVWTKESPVFYPDIDEVWKLILQVTKTFILVHEFPQHISSVKF
jgi:hypothetical protein